LVASSLLPKEDQRNDRPPAMGSLRGLSQHTARKTPWRARSSYSPGSLCSSHQAQSLDHMYFGLARQTFAAGSAAKSTTAAPQPPVTKQGIIVGTFQYMSTS